MSIFDDNLANEHLPAKEPGANSSTSRLAAEFAHRFATEHTALRDDEDFWNRCAQHFSDELLADLALSCALWVGMGRVLRTLDIAQSCKLTLPSRV